VEEELKHQRELIKTLIEQMDKRFDAVDKRFESMQKQMDDRFDALTRRIDRSMIWSFAITLTVGAISKQVIRHLAVDLATYLLKLDIDADSLELLETERQRVEDRRADLVARVRPRDTPEAFILHIEIQNNNDSLMPWRMLRYQSDIRLAYPDTPVRQHLIYTRRTWVFGKARCAYRAREQGAATSNSNPYCEKRQRGYRGREVCIAAENPCVTGIYRPATAANGRGNRRGGPAL